MAADTNEQSALKAAVDTARGFEKVAAELKSRLDKAPKPAAPEALKAAAERLVDFRWVENMDVEKVAAYLADPTTALNTLAQVAQKAAEKLAQVAQQANPRLEVGKILGTNKQASDEGVQAAPESEAARIWNEKMASRRQSMN